MFEPTWKLLGLPGPPMTKSIKKSSWITSQNPFEVEEEKSIDNFNEFKHNIMYDSFSSVIESKPMPVESKWKWQEPVIVEKPTIAPKWVWQEPVIVEKPTMAPKWVWQETTATTTPKWVETTAPPKWVWQETTVPTTERVWQETTIAPKWEWQESRSGDKFASVFGNVGAFRSGSKNRKFRSRPKKISSRQNGKLKSIKYHVMKGKPNWKYAKWEWKAIN